MLKVVKDKLRGGYYTSSDIARWLCAWSIRSKNDRVLEPSCGDGIFLEEAACRLLELGSSRKNLSNQIKGIELFPSEAKKAFKRLSPLITNKSKNVIISDDFFTWLEKNNEHAFDCIVGNPPFIRYQNFPEPSRSKAMSLLKRLNLKPNKLTNIWVPFVAGATDILLPKGRFALVLPVELLQVSYARQLRNFLVEKFESLKIFTCNQLLFKGAEQETVLFLADGKRENMSSCTTCFINLHQTKDQKKLLSHKPTIKMLNRNKKTVNHKDEKWTKYFLSTKEISLMRELRMYKEIVNLSYHAEVDVGVVTGANDFFVRDKKFIESCGIQKNVIPIIGRSAQLKGVCLRENEFNKLAKNNQRVYLFYISRDKPEKLTQAIKRYITEGEKEQFHKGYKCSIRNPWYCVPSVWIPDFFLFRQIHDFPRLVINYAKATSTDTIHRMKCKKDPKEIVSSYYTHLTAASAEIEGRSYGGGVLELEPTEAERLLLPKDLFNGVPVQESDRLIRAGRLGDLLEENDKQILMKKLGLSRNECNMLRRIWTKMRERRHSRRKTQY